VISLIVREELSKERKNHDGGEEGRGRTQREKEKMSPAV